MIGGKQLQPIEMQALLTNINAGIVDQELPTQLCAGALCLGWYLNLKSTGPWKTDLSSIVEGRSLLECKPALTSLLSAYKGFPMPVHGRIHAHIG